MKNPIKILTRWMVALILLVGFTHSTAADTDGTTELVSEILDSVPDPEIDFGMRQSSYASLNRTGRWVVFSSEESSVNLAGTSLDINDNAGNTYRWDVFLRDRQSPAITYLISRYRVGNEDSYSIWGAISPDGQYAVFQSNAPDVDFEGPCGEIEPSVSGANFQLYLADLRNLADIKIYLVSRYFTDSPVCYWEEGNADSGKASGRMLNSYFPAAVYSIGNKIEVIFQSRAGNLTLAANGGGQDLYSYRADISSLAQGSIKLLTRPVASLEEVFQSGYFRAPSVSADGSHIAFVLGTDEPESSSGQIYLMNRDFNNDGEFDDLGSIPSYLLVSKNWETMDPGNHVSNMPSLSADGVVLAYASRSTNLLKEADWIPDANNVSDIFLFNLRTENNRLISLNSTGQQAAQGTSISPSISRNGKLVTFQSNAANITSTDSDSGADVFLYRQDIVPAAANDIVLISVNNDDINSNNTNSLPGLPTLAGDGVVAAFTDYSTNMPYQTSGAPTVGNIYSRVIVHDPPWNTDPKPLISESPSNWYFGIPDSTWSSQKTFRISNIGDADLDISRIQVVAQGNFSWQVGAGLDNNCMDFNYPNGATEPAVPFTLAPMQNCFIYIQYFVEVGDTGVHTAYILIESNDPEMGSLTIDMSGGSRANVYLPFLSR